MGTTELPSSPPRASEGILYAADLNGDQNLDVVWESKFGFHRSVVWLGDGKGGFSVYANPHPENASLASVPPVPYRSSSSSSASPGWLTQSAAEARQRRSAVSVLPQSPYWTARPKRSSRVQEVPPRSSSEIEVWLAHTINPPPSSILS
ncbi:VCBS repeat-containing protein [Bryobacter aggregatus]|uniref:VCBS repeat-containing protein n=1 Tax=Bryobacter aggregatus TaxID=360054 RepID=UPI0012BAA76E|nr:VCBS repeat-containing protein [Bryobacter aggregatus]